MNSVLKPPVYKYSLTTLSPTRSPFHTKQRGVGVHPITSTWRSEEPREKTDETEAGT
ncbi:hypothetical protein SAMN04488067_109127 [Halorubrum xinjiangense]|uniref:Uncharacterized protein n=1 Tax=Halorubrum xinjiangense TaxID=261291 RepID=A0A1G7PD60_9EURY|nr:hypothetical protein SAMN04488067_109127 [Halorubrum xinjiangense]